jgi:predicted Zn-dependent peptidase
MALRPARAAFLLALALASRAHAAPDQVSLDSQVLRLDNGMTFLLVDRPAAGVVAAGWVVRVGSADDPAGQSGISHLLEHMMFKGTRTLAGPDDYDRIYGRAGATSINAFTTPDLTAYFVSVPANRLELWFWMESNRLLEPVFGGLQAEHQVIAEEKRRREATPTGPFGDQLDALFWQEHPYRRPRLGLPSDVGALTEPNALHHFQTWYRPANLTAVLVGRFDRGRAAELARRYFGRLPAAPAPERAPVPESAQRAERRMLAECDCPSQVELRYHTVPFLHADADALDVLAALLDSRLRQALIISGLASAASVEQSSFARAGYFAVRAQVAKPDVSPEQLEQAWYDVLRRLQQEPVPAGELERVEDGLVADGLRRLEDPFALMVQLLTFAGRGDWRYLQEQPRRIRAVTAADVQRVAQTWFRPENRTVALFRRKG